MAKIEKKVVTQAAYVMSLDETEAGVLLDLLRAHVAGSASGDEMPLGGIRVALENSGVKRVYLRNVNAKNSSTNTYNRPYAVLEN